MNKLSSANPNKVVPLGSSTERFVLSHDRDQFATRTENKEIAMDSVEEDQTGADERRGKGEFVRGISQQRRRITRNGDGEGEVPAESGRYHLYVANNCPWCHRVILARAVLGLQEAISVDVLFYRRDPEKGWQFLPNDDLLREDELQHKDRLFGDGRVAKIDSINGLRYAPEIYQLVGSKERSVPILFDKKTNTIVNNESAEIIRMFAQGFTAFHKKDAPHLYPSGLRLEIDSLNTWIYRDINNGAYKAGFSSSQETYEKAYKAYFDAFARLESILQHRRFLTGEKPTEADIRLFPTVVRHDPVYYSRFKLNRAMVRWGYPHLARWMDEMLALEGVEEATNIEHCVRGYFGRTGNGLVPSPLMSKWY